MTPLPAAQVNVTSGRTSDVEVVVGGAIFTSRTTILAEDRDLSPTHQQLSFIATFLYAGAGGVLGVRLTSTSVLTSPAPVTGTLTITTASPATSTPLDVTYVEDVEIKKGVAEEDSAD